MKLEEEFVNSIPEFEKLPQATQTALLIHFLTHNSGGTVASTAEIARLRASLHLAPHAGLAVFLSRRTQRRDGKVYFVKKPKGYALEMGYAKELREEFLGRPSAKALAKTLRTELAGITDPVAKSFAEEAVACFEASYYRAAIVLGWATAYAVFRGWLFKHHLAAFNAVTSAWKKPFLAVAIDDFQEQTESDVLQAVRTGKIISKEQHKTLKELLDKRNSIAHPAPKAVTPAIAEAFLDLILQEVLPTYS